MLNGGKAVMNDNKIWRLYGTVGCHLCDDVVTLLQQVQAVYDVAWKSVDIMDLPEPEMLVLAEKIPVLQTPNGMLYYPFSLLDMVEQVQS